MNDNTVIDTDIHKTWALWNQELAGGGPLKPDTNLPSTGYWRVRQSKGGPFVPIIYWYEGDEPLCLIGQEVPDNLQRAIDMWPWAAKHPIPVADYDYWVVNKRWPGDNQLVDQYEAKPEQPAPPASRGIAVPGHNLPPPEGSYPWFEGMVRELTLQAEDLIKAGPAKDQAACDRAANLAQKLGELNKTKPAELAARDPEITEDMREVVDRYKLLAGRWVTTQKLTSIYVQLKQVVVLPGLSAIKKAQQQADASREAHIPQRRPTVTAGGAHSARGIGIREEKFAVVDDWNLAIGYFSANEKLRALVQQLATASVKQGTVPTGCRADKRDVAS